MAASVVLNSSQTTCLLVMGEACSNRPITIIQCKLVSADSSNHVSFSRGATILGVDTTMVDITEVAILHTGDMMHSVMDIMKTS